MLGKRQKVKKNDYEKLTPLNKVWTAWHAWIFYFTNTVSVNFLLVLFLNDSKANKISHNFSTLCYS